MVIGIGRALRLIPLVLTLPKRYIGVVQFHGAVSRTALQGALGEFEGPVFQTPPVRSAVKRERRVRKIHSLKLLEFAENSALIDVSCESGTYVRTLAVDLGEVLGVGGHLAELRRVGTGPFTELEMVSLSMLSDAMAMLEEGNPSLIRGMLHDPSRVWKKVPMVYVKDSAVDALAHGADLAAAGVTGVSAPFGPGDRVAIVTAKEELVATGKALVLSQSLREAKSGWVVDADSVFMAPGVYPRLWGTASGGRKGEKSPPSI